MLYKNYNHPQKQEIVIEDNSTKEVGKGKKPTKKANKTLKKE